MNYRDTNMSQGFRATKDQLDWGAEEGYWRDNWASRPYASADLGFDYYRPAYRYGFESASQTPRREWRDVEDELRSGWDRYEHRGTSAWEHVKDAVRDGWHRVVDR
jgi:hypothetical protein